MDLFLSKALSHYLENSKLWLVQLKSPIILTDLSVGLIVDLWHLSPSLKRLDYGSRVVILLSHVCLVMSIRAKRTTTSAERCAFSDSHPKTTTASIHQWMVR